MKKKCRACGKEEFVNGYSECSPCYAARVEAQRKASGIMSDSGPEANAAIEAAIAKFPATFGLQAYKGTFRISRRSSFVCGGQVFLYTEAERNGEWSDFVKGTPEELKRAIVVLP